MTSELALQGLRVIDLSNGVAGAYCAKLLADAGAEVIKVEPPSGDPTRSAGPFPGGTPDPERSPLFLALNTNKQSVTLNLASEEGVGAVRRLLQSADLAIESFAPGTLAGLGLGYDDLAAINPGLGVVSITGFGQTGPYSQYETTHLIHCAMSGWQDTCGSADREPLQAGGLLSEYIAGLNGAIAALSVHHGRQATGRGHHVDISTQETLSLASNFEPTRAQYTGGGRSRAAATGIYEAVDGYVGCTPATDAQWNSLRDLTAIPELQDPKFSGAGRTQYRAEIKSLLEGWIRQRSVLDVVHQGQDRRIIVNPVASVKEVLELEPYRARGYFVEMEHPVAGKLTYAGAPFRLPETPARPWSPAPLLGQHNEAVLRDELGYEPQQIAAMTSSGPTPSARPPRKAAPAVAANGTNGSSSGPLPLADVKILDASWWFAGPTAISLLADLGAQVIKVESVQAMDNRRTIAVRNVPDRQWENSAGFNSTNRNKLGITLNLKDPRGAEIFRKLVGWADLVAENYSSRVMASFGLDYESLTKVKPDIIMLSMAGFGVTGPWKDYVSHAGGTEGTSGIAQLMGYPGGPPLTGGFGDPLAGLNGAVAALVALEYRRRTGKGQHVDVSQAEACTGMLGEEILAYQLTGELPARRGNSHPEMAPHGIYPCEGKEQWVAIAVRSDEEWARFAGIAGLAAGGAYATLAGRLAHRDEIDASISEWTRPQSPRAVMERLQEAGIPAGIVFKGVDLLEDPHMRAREFFEWIERDGDGGAFYSRQPIRFSGADTRTRMPAPTMGQHNYYVLHGMLGMTEAELEELERANVIGTTPLSARA